MAPASPKSRSRSWLKLERHMGIAIRIDATKSSLKSLVDDYTKQGRAGLTVTCPESKCRQEYIVYHGSSMDEAQLREGIAPYLTRDHPKHPVIYEIDESTPDDLKKMGAIVLHRFTKRFSRPQQKSAT